jgi:hypothetical protein
MILKALIFIQIHHTGENAEEKYIWKNYNIYVGNPFIVSMFLFRIKHVC